MMNESLAAFAAKLAKLADAYKADRAQLLAEAVDAGIEPAALRRLVTWMRKDELARLEQEAVDDQYRYIVGLRDKPAELPSGGRLAEAAALYGEGLTIRDVAKKMGISVGTGHTLKRKVAAFNVQSSLNMNVPSEEPPQLGVTMCATKSGGAKHSQPSAVVDSAFPEMPEFLQRHRKPEPS